MKIGLMHIPKFVTDYNTLTDYSNFVYPPLGVFHIYGYLKAKGYDISFLDIDIKLMKDTSILPSGKPDIAENAIAEILESYDLSGFDILGIGLHMDRDISLLTFVLKWIKTRYPDISIIIGGPALFLYYEVFLGLIDEGLLDYIIVGYGEIPIEKVILSKNRQDLISVPGLIFKHDDHLVINIKDSPPLDLEAQKIRIDKGYLDSFRLFNFPVNVLNNIFLSALIPYYCSTGCYFKCAFCVESRSPLVRSKSPKDVVKDLKKLTGETGIRYISFLDNNIAISPTFLDELSGWLIEEDLDILWCASIRAAPFLTDELFRKMRRSGCIYLDFGMETYSETLLKKMEKSLSVREIESCIQKSHNAGIWNGANILVGLPGETETDFQLTLEGMERNQGFVNQWEFHPFKLVPSRILNDPGKFGLIVKDRKKFDSAEMRLKGLLVSYEYDEIDGPDFEQLEIIKNKRIDTLQKSLRRHGYKSKTMMYTEILFPLFDLLKTKGRVEEFMQSNYRLLTKSRFETCMVPVGLGSNQRGVQQGHAEEHSFLETPSILRYMADFRKQGFSDICITGGEPLIHPQIIKILKSAREVGFSGIYVCTNARMLKYKDLCKGIAQYADQIIVVALSDDQEVYDKKSGVAGSYVQMRQGIDNWLSLGKVAKVFGLNDS